MKYLEHRLSNGLTIIAEQNPDAYSLGVGFFVRTGARDESRELSGVSHFLEHMCFKGTPRRTAADVNRELDELGSMSNAETSEEHTIYYTAVLPELQQRAVDLLADIMRPSLRPDDFELEKKVILEEIAKYEDQPPYGAFEKSLAAYFGDHALGRPILGTVDSVTSLTPERMRAYFDRQYSPGNMALVAAGKVDFVALVKQAESLCGDWTPLEVRRDVAPPPTHEGIALHEKSNVAQQYVLWVLKAPAVEDNARYAARLVNMIVGDDSGSRLFWELIDNGRAEYAGLFSHEYQGVGVTFAYLCCAPEEAQENLQRMAEVMRGAGQGIEAEELIRAQNKASSSVVVASERPRNRLFEVGGRWLKGQPYRTVRGQVDVYMDVTVRDLQQQLQSYPLTGGMIVSVGPATDLKPPA